MWDPHETLSRREAIGTASVAEAQRKEVESGMRSQAGSCRVKQGWCLPSCQRAEKMKWRLRHQKPEVPGKESSIRA